MDKLNLPFYYELGVRLRAATQFQLPLADDQRFNVAIAALNLGEPVQGALGIHGISVSRASGYNLLNSIDTISKWDFTKTAASVEDKIDAAGFVSAARAFETVLLAELQSVASYIVSPKGIYSTPALIELAELVFPESVHSKLNASVVDEVRQAGKCLAFDTATAAGFHAMWAVEGVMHEYYVVICNPADKVKHLDNWGAYIAEFRKIVDPDVQEVVALLQQIKDLHRNLIMHPEVVLTPDEAFTLFELAKGAIMAMTGKLPVIAPAAVVP